jgi:hypothetical protein
VGLERLNLLSYQWSVRIVCYTLLQHKLQNQDLRSSTFFAPLAPNFGGNWIEVPQSWGIQGASA